MGDDKKNELLTSTTYPPDSAMAALPSAKMRAYVEALFTVQQGKGAYAAAAREAGYAAKDAHSLANVARNLNKDARVRDAIAEMVKAKIRELGPKAVAAVSEILDTTHHAQRLKAALATLERIEPSVQRIEVKTEKVDRTAETLKYLDHLLSLGASQEVLEREFGAFGLSYYSKLLAEKKSAEPKVIEAEFEIIKDTPAEPANEQAEETFEDLL